MMTKPLTEEEIDNIVIAQADDDSAWEDPISVKATEIRSTIELPKILAAKAAFFARLHKKANVEEWITSIIQERIDFEESAFVELKHALAQK